MRVAVALRTEVFLDGALSSAGAAGETGVSLAGSGFASTFASAFGSALVSALTSVAFGSALVSALTSVAFGAGSGFASGLGSAVEAAALVVGFLAVVVVRWRVVG